MRPVSNRPSNEQHPTSTRAIPEDPIFNIDRVLPEVSRSAPYNRLGTAPNSNKLLDSPIALVLGRCTPLSKTAAPAYLGLEPVSFRATTTDCGAPGITFISSTRSWPLTMFVPTEKDRST